MTGHPNKRSFPGTRPVTPPFGQLSRQSSPSSPSRNSPWQHHAQGVLHHSQSWRKGLCSSCPSAICARGLLLPSCPCRVGPRRSFLRRGDPESGPTLPRQCRSNVRPTALSRQTYRPGLRRRRESTRHRRARKRRARLRGPSSTASRGPAHAIGHVANASRRRPCPGPRCAVGAPIGDESAPTGPARDRAGRASRVRDPQDGSVARRPAFATRPPSNR